MKFQDLGPLIRLSFEPNRYRYSTSWGQGYDFPKPQPPELVSWTDELRSRFSFYPAKGKIFVNFAENRATLYAPDPDLHFRVEEIPLERPHEAILKARLGR
jgi:hypothetical protein